MKLIKYFSNILKRKKKQISQQELDLSSKLEKIIGYTPHTIAYFIEAFTLKTNKRFSNFERLEFLGDSVLGSIISAHLYLKFLNKNEGFLTQMKSKIVNRQNLNFLGEKFELIKLIANRYNQNLSRDISGNLFEALIGAIFLDVGYETCRKIVMTQFFTEAELLKLEHKIVSYKALLMQTCQQQKIELKMQIELLELPNQNNSYHCKLYVDGNLIANASDFSKKKAEEKACRRTYYYLLKSGRLHFETE